jgi:GTP cyclohydrolase I
VRSEKQKMRDVQKSHDTRNIAINKVGVKDISYPIVVMDKYRSLQHTVARVNMFVDLPHHFKGTHMSRFIEILNKYREKIALDNMEVILKKMKNWRPTTPTWKSSFRTSLKKRRLSRGPEA